MQTFVVQIQYFLIFIRRLNMLKRIFAASFILALALSFTTLTFAQDQTKTDEVKKEEPKMEMKKDEMKKEGKSEEMAGPLKSVSCDPACGFMVRSHDEKEVMTAAKSH